MQYTFSRRSFTQLLKIIVGILLVCGIAGYATWSYAQERNDLPPFDHEKAKALSPEKRTEYDRLLFNEITKWDSGSRRHTRETREVEWESMAANGHELSYWFLRSWSPTRGQFSNKKALKRLGELAEQGDTSAMCGYIAILTYEDQHNKKLYSKAFDYLRRGTELGHPACQEQLGNLLIGVGAKYLRDGMKIDVPRGYALLTEAAEAGYDVGSLYIFFLWRGVTNAKNVERTYCWAYIDYEYFEADVRNDQFRTEVRWLREVRDFAEKNNRSDLLQLADRLKGTHPTVQQCVALGY